MTSDEPYERFRMPGRLFDELAEGGGSAEAVAFLLRSERTRRLLLLRELLARLDEQPDVLGGPAASIWRYVEEAALRDPDAVEALLLSPQAGSWLAHMLRRLHGTASGPPLWADAGQLAALALVACVRSGTDADLRVPALAGSVNLPTLGLMLLPGPAEKGDNGARWVPAVVRDRRVTAGPAGRTVTVRPLEDERGAHWLPLRTLRAGPGGPPIWLDDLDPYRDLDEPVGPAPLDAADTRAWQTLLDEAVEILRPSGPEPGRLRPEEISRIVPWRPAPRLLETSPDVTHDPAGPGGTDAGTTPGVRLSASTGDAFGSMMIARPPGALDLAETLVHEFQHSKLGALLHLFPLLGDNRDECHYAPWRPDPRHLPGLLHGAYAFTGVAGFWRERLGDKEADPTGLAPFQFALRRLQTRLVVRTLATRAVLTPQGRRLVSGLAATLDDWLREPVAPEAVARARAAAVSHRVEWRLRNIAADGTPVGARDGSGDGSDDAYWQDDRVRLYGLPPVTYGAGASADELLTSGDQAAALPRYAADLRAHPDDPHALAGWLLGWAAGRADGRRLLARPERFRAALTAAGIAPGDAEGMRETAGSLLRRGGANRP